MDGWWMAYDILGVPVLKLSAHVAEDRFLTHLWPFFRVRSVVVGQHQIEGVASRNGICHHMAVLSDPTRNNRPPLAVKFLLDGEAD